MGSRGKEGGRSGECRTRSFKLGRTLAAAFMPVCDAAASDLRQGAGKHKPPPIGAGCDRWIIYVPPPPLWQSCFLTGARGSLRMPATLLTAVAGSSSFEL